MDWVATVYLFCFAAGLAFAIISGLLSGFSAIGGGDVGGGDFDADVGGDFDADVGGDFDADAGGADADVGDGGSHGAVTFSPFSPVVMAMFITAFGGVGMILDGMALPALVSMPVSVASGIGVAIITFWLFYKLFKMTQGSSEPNQAELIGLEAEVLIPIPANGVGKIAYIARERRFTAGARSETGEAIKGHATVRIERIVGGIHIVRRTEDEQLREMQ